MTKFIMCKNSAILSCAALLAAAFQVEQQVSPVVGLGTVKQQSLLRRRGNSRRTKKEVENKHVDAARTLSSEEGARADGTEGTSLSFPRASNLLQKKATVSAQHNAGLLTKGPLTLVRDEEEDLGVSHAVQHAQEVDGAADRKVGTGTAEKLNWEDKDTDLKAVVRNTTDVHDGDLVSSFSSTTMETSAKLQEKKSQMLTTTTARKNQLGFHMYSQRFQNRMRLSFSLNLFENGIEGVAERMGNVARMFTDPGEAINEMKEYVFQQLEKVAKQVSEMGFSNLIWKLVELVIGGDKVDMLKPFLVQCADKFRTLLSQIMGSTTSQALDGLMAGGTASGTSTAAEDEENEDGSSSTSSSTSSFAQKSRKTTTSSKMRFFKAKLLSRNNVNDKIMQNKVAPSEVSGAFSSLFKMELFTADGFLKAFKDLVSHVKEMIKSQFMPDVFTASLTTFLHSIGEMVTEFITENMGKPFDTIVAAGKKLQSDFNNFVGGLQDGLDHVGEQFEDFADNVGNAAKDVGNRMTDAANDVKSGFKDAASAMKDSMQEGWDRLSWSRRRGRSSFLLRGMKSFAPFDTVVLDHHPETVMSGASSPLEDGDDDDDDQGVSFFERKVKHFEAKYLAAVKNGTTSVLAGAAPATISNEARFHKTLQQIWKNAQDRHEAFLQADPLEELVEVEITDRHSNSTTTSKRKQIMTRGSFLQLEQKDFMDQIMQFVLKFASYVLGKNITSFSDILASLVDVKAIIHNIQKAVLSLLGNLGEKFIKPLISVFSRTFFQVIYDPLVSTSSQFLGDTISGLIGAGSPVSFVGGMIGPTIQMTLLQVGTTLQGIVLPLFKKALEAILPSALTKLFKGVTESIADGNTEDVLKGVLEVGSNGDAEVVAEEDGDEDSTSSTSRSSFAQKNKKALATSSMKKTSSTKASSRKTKKTAKNKQTTRMNQKKWFSSLRKTLTSAKDRLFGGGGGERTTTTTPTTTTTRKPTTTTPKPTTMAPAHVHDHEHDVYEDALGDDIVGEEEEDDDTEEVERPEREQEQVEDDEGDLYEDAVENDDVVDKDDDYEDAMEDDDAGEDEDQSATILKKINGKTKKVKRDLETVNKDQVSQDDEVEPGSGVVDGEDEMARDMAKRINKAVVVVHKTKTSSEEVHRVDDDEDQDGTTSSSTSFTEFHVHLNQKHQFKLSLLHEKVLEKRQKSDSYSAMSDFMISGMKTAFSYIRTHYLPKCPEGNQASPTQMAQAIDSSSQLVENLPFWSTFQEYLKSVSEVQLRGLVRSTIEKVIDVIGSGLFETVIPFLVSLPVVGNAISSIKPGIRAAFNYVAEKILEQAERIEDWLAGFGEDMGERLVNMFLERVPCLNLVDQMEEWILGQAEMDDMTEAALTKEKEDAEEKDAAESHDVDDSAAGSTTAEEDDDDDDTTDDDHDNVFVAEEEDDDDEDQNFSTSSGFVQKRMQMDRFLRGIQDDVVGGHQKQGEEHFDDVAGPNDDDDEAFAKDIVSVKLLRRLNVHAGTTTGRADLQEHYNFDVFSTNNLTLLETSSRSYTAALATETSKVQMKQKMNLDTFFAKFNEVKEHIVTEIGSKLPEFVDKVSELVKNTFQAPLKTLLSNNILASMIAMLGKGFCRIVVMAFQAAMPFVSTAATTAGNAMLGEANMKMITSAASTVMPWLISNFLYEATPIHNALKMLVDKLLADETIKGIFDAVAEVMKQLKGIGAFSLFTDALEEAWNSIKSKLTGADLPSEEVTNEVEAEHENALSALTFTKEDLIEEELATECPSGYEPLADSDECVAAMRLLYPPDLTLAESERKPWNQVGLSKAEKIAVISERNVPLGCLKKWDMVKRSYTLEYNREAEDDVAAGRHLQKVNLICVRV